MADGQPRRRGAWVAWVDLEQAVRAEFPEVDPLRVMHAVETGDVGYRLRCKPYDDGDLVPDPFSMAWIEGPTILPYRLQAQDWDEFDREAGRFRHYPLEVSWQSVCRFLNPVANEVELLDAEVATQMDGGDVEADCRRWLVGLLRADPENKRRWKKADVIHAARERSTSFLSGAAFVRAWGAATKATKVTDWSKTGPRGKAVAPTKH